MGPDDKELRELTAAMNAVQRYCGTVEGFSQSHEPRLLAEIYPATIQAGKWVEFPGKGEWERAGKPKPIAWVWYKDRKIVRVAMAFDKSDESSVTYADYCYQPTGKLARLASEPHMQTACEQAYFRCQLTFGIEWLYLPNGKKLQVIDQTDRRLLKSEQTSVSVSKPAPPEYLEVGEFPLARLLMGSGAQAATEPGAPGATVWGDAVNGLEMSLFFDPRQTGTKPQLRVGLRNVGSSAIELTLGSSCGSDRIEPNMITLVLTDDQGKSQRLTDIGPEPSLDPCTALVSSSLWRETLAPSASFSIPINVDYYKNLSRFTVSDLLAVKDGQQLERGWQPGRTYSVQAEFPIGPAAKGPHIAKSNQLRVHFPAEQQ